MKTIIQLFIIILFSSTAQAQYTAVPDDQFEIILILKGIDSEGIFDGQVLTSDMEAVTSLVIWNVVYLNDLTGIEACINLETLRLKDVGISTLDLSNNIQLKILDIFDTAIESLNISQNESLIDLRIGHCSDGNNNCFFETPPISVLDIHNNVALKFLSILNLELANIDLSNNLLLDFIIINNITTNILDFSNNEILHYLRIYNNYNLSTINLKSGYNTDLNYVDIHDNNNLSCLQVDDPAAVITGTEPPYDNWTIEGDPLITDDCTIGLDEQLMSAFKIYPNPVTTIMHIESDINYTIKSIKIYDLFGRLIQINNICHKSIDLSNIPQGIFLIKIETDKGFYSELVLKN